MGAQAARLWPLMNSKDLVGAVYLPGDGQTNPTDTTQAYAKGAKLLGAQIFENVKATGIRQQNGRVSGVTTDSGDIECEFVVNCAGMWANRRTSTRVTITSVSFSTKSTKRIP